jgi:predicted Zn-dependent protease
MPAPPLKARQTPRRHVLLALVGAAGVVLIGCEQQDLAKVALKIVPPETMNELGLKTWARIRQQFPPSPDRALQARLKAIGARIVAASHPDEAHWEFVVFRADEINAFALPGGRIGFFEGMFEVARNDAQIAAVVGHEVGHINAHHGAQRLAAGLVKEIGLKALLTALNAGDVAYANQIAAVLGAGIEYGLILPYSRRQEFEADALGVGYMQRAGYAPREAVAFWRQLMALSEGRPRPLEFLSTHPSDDKRIEALEALIAAPLPHRP